MYERDEQTIGRYQIFVRGSGWDLDVIMRVIATNVERNLTPSEAMCDFTHKLEMFVKYIVLHSLISTLYFTSSI